MAQDVQTRARARVWIPNILTAIGQQYDSEYEALSQMPENASDARALRI